MERLTITDNKHEMIRIGENIYNKYPKIYNRRMKDLLFDSIIPFTQGFSDEDMLNCLFESIYHYWVYGASIKQFFFYRFFEKEHKEKESYLTLRNRFPYIYYLNKKDDWHLLENKFEAYILLKDFYRRDVIRVKDYDDFHKFSLFVNKHKEFIVKPGGVGCSIGVQKKTVSQLDDLHKVFDSVIAVGEKTNRKYGHWKHIEAGLDVVLEEVIKEDSRISCLHPYSLNPLRITTIRINNEVKFFYPRISIGNNKEYITNASVGALVAGINVDTGIVETNGFSEFCEEYEEHPISHIKIKGFQIPRWEEMKLMLKEAALRLPSIRYVGWDVVLSNKGWCIIEGNFFGEFTQQVAYGRGCKQEFEELIGWKPEKQFWWEN